MSSVNGDKSRYHRQRKKKIAQRERNRELVQQAAKSAKPSPKTAPSPVSA
jgi:hypothetical protein